MKTRHLHLTAFGASMTSDRVAALTGTGAVTSPVWFDLVNPAYQALIAFLGLIVLVLTVRAKILDLQIKRETLLAMRGQCKVVASDD